MSQLEPTHDELVSEEMMMTQGVHDDTQWCNRIHADIFSTENQPHVFILFRVDVVTGYKAFKGVFTSHDACLAWITTHDMWWGKRNVEPFYSIEEVAVQK
jgi:hypothetical protein